MLRSRCTLLRARRCPPPTPLPRARAPPQVPVTIAVVGKYTNLSDAYLSVTKALYHAANKAERKLVVR